MAKLIDYGYIRKKTFYDPDYGERIVYLQDIGEAPTEYSVELVRCRDCKYSTLPSLVTQRYGVPGALTCHNHNSPCNKRNVKGECFCPYGERKDGDGNG